jgi:hypothetical protein
VGVYRAEKAKATTSLSYKGKLDEQSSARFSEVSEALEAWPPRTDLAPDRASDR